LPEGTTIRTGVAAAKNSKVVVPDWKAKGGGQQFEIVDSLDETWFKPEKNWNTKK
jgi:hypothetical protein